MTSTARAARRTTPFPPRSAAATAAATRRIDDPRARREGVRPGAHDAPADGLNEILLALIAGRGLSNLLYRLTVLRNRLEEDSPPRRRYGLGDAGERHAPLAALCQLATRRAERLARLRGMDAPPIVQRNEERILVAALTALLETAGTPDTPPPYLLPVSGPSSSIGKEMP